MSKATLPSNPKYSRMFDALRTKLESSFFCKGYIKDIESLIRISDDETIARIDDVLFNEASSNDQQITTQ
jgi:hypothetical protein